MKKTHYRDYATEAFRFYAREGGADTYRDKMADILASRKSEQDGIRAGISKPVEAAVMRREDLEDDIKASIADLEAVEITLETLKEKRNGDYIIQAVKNVYMVYPNDPIEGKVKARVLKFADDLPADRSTVYRWLSKARTEFARARKLRF